MHSGSVIKRRLPPTIARAMPATLSTGGRGEIRLPQTSTIPLAATPRRKPRAQYRGGPKTVVPTQPVIKATVGAPRVRLGPPAPGRVPPTVEAARIRRAKQFAEWAARAQIAAPPHGPAAGPVTARVSSGREIVSTAKLGKADVARIARMGLGQQPAVSDGNPRPAPAMQLGLWAGAGILAALVIGAVWYFGARQ